MNDRPLYSRRMRGPLGPAARQPKSANRKVPFIIITLLLGAAVVWYFGGLPLSGHKQTEADHTPIKIVDENDFRQVIVDELFKLGLKQEWVTRKTAAIGQEQGTFFTVRMPTDIPLVLANLRLHQLMQQAGGQVVSAEENFARDQLILTVGRQGGPVYRLFLKQDQELKRGIIRIAFVFDQPGDPDDQAFQDLLALRQRFTLVLVPGTKQCKALARTAQDNGLECVLQIPYKTREQVLMEPDKYALLTTFSEGQVRKHLDAVFDELPQAAGFYPPPVVSTARNKELTARIMKALKQRSAYFLDPDTGRGTELARSTGVRTARASIIIGEQQSRPEIREQLDLLTQRAVETGQALGLGHCVRETVATVKDYLPQLAGRGVQLVYASELAE